MCVPPLRLCICEVCVCVCVSTWMYLNLLLFTPIVQLCLRELLWSNWMSRGRGKPVAANVEPAGLIICNTAAALPVRFLIRSWIQKWMRWTSEVNTEGRNRPRPVLISFQIEQSLYPPPQLRGELVFNIPGHAFWQGTPPKTTNGLKRLLRDTLMFLMSKLELNMPLGLQQLICLIRRKTSFNKRLFTRKENLVLSLWSLCSYACLNIRFSCLWFSLKS